MSYALAFLSTSWFHVSPNSPKSPKSPKAGQRRVATNREVARIEVSFIPPRALLCLTLSLPKIKVRFFSIIVF